MLSRTALQHQPRLCLEVGMLCPHIPGRELLGEVATRRLWSVCKELGAVLLETTEEAGPAETPTSEALDLHTKMGALLSKS